MNLVLKVQCCPLCGRPLTLTTRAGEKEYLARERFAISVGRYLGGQGRARERFKFGGEVCAEPCAADLERLLEPLIRYVQEREINR